MNLSSHPSAFHLAYWPCEVAHNSIICEGDPPRLDKSNNEPPFSAFDNSVRIVLVLGIIALLSCEPLLARQKPFVVAWALICGCGAATGAAMALYQFVLNTSIDFTWGVVGTWMERTVSLPLPLLIPPILLSLTAFLADRIPNGGASLFVKSVLHSESIPIFTAMANIPLVSIIAITSGGSAGPEGPVLPIGGGIGAWYHGVLQRHAAGGSRTVQCLGDFILVGGCASIAAFFDDPLAGCIFVMEVPHFLGLSRAHVLPASLLGSCCAWFAHRLLMVPLGIEYRWVISPDLPCISPIYPHLLVPSRISPHLPTPPHTSPYLPISPHISSV